MNMISIITPVLNESENIKPFLDKLQNLKGDFEVIFIDGGSTDDTVVELEKMKHGFKKPMSVLSASRGRGNQMNNGAKHAKGEILLFLHVDSYIERDSLLIIDKTLTDSKVIGGGFVQSFSDPDIFFRLSSALGNLQSKVTKIFFGDFGIFIRKVVFVRMGGYDNIPFLEDVEFCRRAKKYGKLQQINRLIVTSARRYYSKGRIKLTVAFIIAILLNIVRLRPNFLFKYITEM
jgi:rSAM/selenodomain-associated transferase 2